MFETDALATDGGLFGPISTNGAIRVGYRNPRHVKAYDLLMLTDLRGMVLDVAVAGAPSANAMRLKRKEKAQPDEALFGIEDAPEAFYVYSLSTGRYVLGGDPPPPSDLMSYITRVDAGFLVRTQHPDCAPADAMALSLPAEEVVQGLYRDVLQREGDPGGVENYAEQVLDGHRTLGEVAVELAASDEFADRILGKRPAPPVSQFRAKVMFSRHFAEREKAKGRADDVETAFEALGLTFDPLIWDRDYYAAALNQAKGALASFVKTTAPLPLIGA